ncbi:MAG: hypothetical protein ABIP50_04160 [Candidatus Saccharimonadales bacterium]
MLVDGYLYLLGSVIALAMVTVIFIMRKDMRRFIVQAGIIGGFLSVITEFWFYKDYWRIPSTAGIATPSIDDFICGFAFVALSATVYPFIYKLSFKSSNGGWRPFIIPLVVFSLASMVLFVSILKVNSIILASAIPLVVTAYVLIRMPNLYKRAIFGATFLGILAFVTYGILFGIVSPYYIDNYFLLAHHPLNPNPFGFIPLSELMWFISMGAVGGVLYEYIVHSQSQKTIKK